MNSNVYDHKTIEAKWQKMWEEENLYKADDNSLKPKFYSLIEFPYPSGKGLHTGHIRSNTAMDIISRKRRMEGYNVLYPIGWDAFGLPTENYAIKTGVHPKIVTKQNTDNFRRQLKMLGFSFDWSREVDTTDPKYYKWTQWIFLQFFKHGLAYKAKMPINWCPSCKIGLANEEAVGGVCDRCGGPTEKREKEQWMLAITKYADRLDKDLDKVDYLEKIKIQQRNWIGRSEGININYPLVEINENITVFTTRPDTNFGATFIAVAPDGEFVKKHLSQIPNKEAVIKYIKESKSKTDIERTSTSKEKSGIFTGWHAINQLTNKKTPIYVSDFVLGTFGTGVVVGVPGHDTRDFDFAQKMGIEVVRVVVGKDGDASPITRREQVQEEDGTMVNSDFLNGLDIHKATEKIKDYIEQKGWGNRVVNYKLRDWVFSRQRYWGEPIPIIHCQKCALGNPAGQGMVPVAEKDLPIELPEIENYKPTDSGESPLSAITEWVNVRCPNCGNDAKRETDTMPNWAGSSWYFLRYIDPHNSEALADPTKMKHWLPIDWYNGGMEHTTLHLLYSRFWHKFLFDIGVVPTDEPYKKRTSHGMILAAGGEKMSKSKGNIVSPDELIETFGADTLRLYEMFMGPFDQAIAWDTNGMVGVRRFIEKVWRSQFKINKISPDDSKMENLLNVTIKKVTKDIESMSFNTAVSQMMIMSNYIDNMSTIGLNEFSSFLKLLAPFAPHLADEIWEAIGHPQSIHKESWPEYNKDKIFSDTTHLAVQINGKVRGSLEIKRGTTEQDALLLINDVENLEKYLDGKSPKRVIYIQDKLLNIVL